MVIKKECIKLKTMIHIKKLLGLLKYISNNFKLVIFQLLSRMMMAHLSFQ